MERKESFLKRKDIEISVKRYLQDAMSAMALGLFGSLLIGVIFDTIGVQTINLFGENAISSFFVEIGGQAKAYMGAAIGVAVAWGLKSPPLVLFTSVVTGMMGANMMGFGIEYSGKDIDKYIQKTDKSRSDYYRYYTGQEWTDARNYDLCLNSEKLGDDGCVEAIKRYMQVRFGEDVLD